MDKRYRHRGVRFDGGGRHRPAGVGTSPWLPVSAAVLVLCAVIAYAAPAVSARLGETEPDSGCFAHHGVGMCVGHLGLGNGWVLPYYHNRVLSGAGVRRAVVVIHGANRKPHDELTDVMLSAAAAGVADHTLVIAPYFQDPADDPGAHEARWTDQGWKQGDDAIAPAGLSSFSVVDQILSILADTHRLPNLRQIVVAGHSAGGQFTQRYAAVGRAPNHIHGISIDYVAANPSSYLYFNPYRPDLSDPTGQHFAIPHTSCAFNDYKYGLRRPNRYVGALTASELRTRYASRHVTYLLGGADTGSHQLDTSCAAELQGRVRVERGGYYHTYLDTFLPAAPDSWAVVAGIGHSTRKMFTSRQGQNALFPSQDRPEPTASLTPLPSQTP